MTLAYRRDLLKLGMIATAGLVFSSFDQAAFAEETGSALTLPGGKGPCSGLPWFSGGFKNPDLFAGWRGRPLDVYTSFVAFDTWAAMLAFPGNTTFPAYSRKPVWLSLAYPLLPKTWGDTPFLSMWDECAEYDPARETSGHDTPRNAKSRVAWPISLRRAAPVRRARSVILSRARAAVPRARA